MAMVDGKYICDLCGCETDEVFTIDGKQVCPHCMDNPYRVNTCADCGTIHLARNMDEDEDGNMICEECAENYDRCWECGRLVQTGYGQYMDNLDRFVCDSCCDGYYNYCRECRRWVHRDDWDYNHDCCYSCTPEDVVKGYHEHKYLYRQETFGDAEEKVGWELEVEGYGDWSPDEMAELLGYNYNKDGTHIVFEHDGSLSEQGFEIISTPHSIDALRSFNLQGMLSDLKTKGFVSHDDENCGLHLHFGRCWFGKTYRSRELGIRRVVAMYELFYNEFVKASRRTADQADDWAKPYNLDWGSFEELYAATKPYHDHPFDRYKAVNLTNNATIEFRLGRGTLNYNTFMAWVDLHATISRNCHKVKNSELNNLDRWFDGIKPETVDYLKGRGAFTSFVRRYEERKAM